MTTKIMAVRIKVLILNALNMAVCIVERAKFVNDEILSDVFILVQYVL